MVMHFVLIIFTFIGFSIQPALGAETFHKACIRSQCYIASVMRKPEELQRGLQGKEELQSNEGMLFVFDHNDYHSFWMRNMRFPIDMIWIDEDYRIVHIENYVPPCQEGSCPIYRPARKARYVLEVNAGEAVKNHFRFKDKVDLINYIPPKKIEENQNDDK